MLYCHYCPYVAGGCSAELELNLKLFSTSVFLFFQTQTLLRNNATASFFSAQLAGTQWNVEDVISFLSKHSEDTRPHGTAFTWRDVFNETDQAIMSISRFMEVRTVLSYYLFLSFLLPHTSFLSHNPSVSHIHSFI